MLRRVLGRLGVAPGVKTGPRILLYHRVYSPERDPQLLCVSPENFAAQMHWLAGNCEVLSLIDIASASPRTLPSNAVAVTFDDGYFDNHSIALPILESESVPATIFVSSGFIDTGREMWWDEAEQIFLGECPTGWHVTEPAGTHAQEEYLTACGRLKFMAPAERTRFLDEMAQKKKIMPRVRDSHRGMTTNELSSLAASRMIAVGGHTVNHVALSSMTEAEQRSEIFADKSTLEAKTRTRLSAFAYPFGTETEFNAVTRNAVESAGYRIACANIPAPVARGMDALAIPRVLVRNWNVQEFASRMRTWMGV